METLEQYLERGDTPAKNSKTAIVMRQLCELCPDLGYEEARRQATVLLDRSAGNKIYRMPVVKGPDQQAAEKVYWATVKEEKTLKQAA